MHEAFRTKRDGPPIEVIATPKAKLPYQISAFVIVVEDFSGKVFALDEFRRMFRKLPAESCAECPGKLVPIGYEIHHASANKRCERGNHSHAKEQPSSRIGTPRSRLLQ